MKRVLVAAAALLIAVGAVVADEVKGKVKSIDPQKKSVVLTVDDKDRTWQGTPDVKVVTSLRGKLKDVPDGMAGIKAGDTVTLTIQKIDDKIVVTQILLDTGKKR
jgi:Cu/Ag efflux protein CusF